MVYRMRSLCVKQFIPAMGRKPRFRQRAECLQLETIHPRKGTETSRKFVVQEVSLLKQFIPARERKLQSGQPCAQAVRNNSSPQGDGNQIVRAEPVADDETIHPRKGTETLVQVATAGQPGETIHPRKGTET